VLESYAYEVWTTQGQYLGWYPCRPEEVVFGYTMLVPEASTAVPDCPATAVGLPWLGLATGNPALGRATFAFEVPRAGAVGLSVFDVEGREVRCLLAGKADRGRHNVEWDGLDARGHRVASGIYFCRLDAEDSRGAAKHLTTRVVLVR
jgi:hypothetical protein